MRTRRMTVTFVSLICLSTFALAGNFIPNAGFTSLGAAAAVGDPVTTCSPSGGALSAAASWTTFIPDPNSCVTTTILPSTDTLPGATGPNMLEFTTNAGFNGSAGNGVFSNGLALPANTTGHVDLFVSPGTSGDIGFVVLGCCFSSGTFAFTPTAGWNRVTFSNPEGPSGEFGLEIFSAGGGTIDIANPFATTPEPGSLLMLATGLAFAGKGFRRTRNQA